MLPSPATNSNSNGSTNTNTIASCRLLLTCCCCYICCCSSCLVRTEFNANNILFLPVPLCQTSCSHNISSRARKRCYFPFFVVFRRMNSIDADANYKNDNNDEDGRAIDDYDDDVSDEKSLSTFDECVQGQGLSSLQYISEWREVEKQNKPKTFAKLLLIVKWEGKTIIPIPTIISSLSGCQPSRRVGELAKNISGTKT